MRRDPFICLLLAGLTLAAFWPVGRLGFIIFDDTAYVTQNPNVQTGFTFRNIDWAFTTTEASNWHPVTWLSHLLDCQMFGLNAGGPHWMSLGFHVANTLLLFIVLRRMLAFRPDPPSQNLIQTDNVVPTVAPPPAAAVWISALVAAGWAVHPLRIESVAWISERKDVLSGFFFLLTLWAYVSYAQKKATLNPQPSTLNYILALLFFALGLMSKPMLVTLPVILLLLDFWPLQRFNRSTIRRLILEKLPFLVLSLASGIITLWAQDKGGAISDLDQVPLDARLENALVSYAAYLGKILWPVHLSIFYPYAEPRAGVVFGCGLLLAGLSAVCLWRARSQPYWLAGWGWFVVMLLPVIGLLQVGRQSIADRYTYLPSIGLFLMLAGGLVRLAAAARPWRAGMALVAAGLLLAWLADTRYQLRYWRDSITLFTHSVAVTPENNCVGHWILGNACLEAGNLEAAVTNYQSALQTAPNFKEVRYQYGLVLLRQKNYAAAEAQFSEAVRLDPDNADAHAGLGHALVNQRKYAEAAVEYANALALRPDDTTLRQALAVATLKAESEKALAHFEAMLKDRPTPEIHTQMAAILTIQERYPEAVDHYLAALQLQPDSADVLNNLAWLLATCPDDHLRDGARAIQYAGRACELTHYRETMMVGTLAAAYAEAGRFEEAVATAQKACALASASGQPELLKKNQELLERYRRHQPYQDAAGDKPTGSATTAPAGDVGIPPPHAP